MQFGDIYFTTNTVCVGLGLWLGFYGPCIEYSAVESLCTVHDMHVASFKLLYLLCMCMANFAVHMLCNRSVAQTFT